MGKIKLYFLACIGVVRHEFFFELQTELHESIFRGGLGIIHKIRDKIGLKIFSEFREFFFQFFFQFCICKHSLSLIIIIIMIKLIF